MTTCNVGEVSEEMWFLRSTWIQKEWISMTYIKHIKRVSFGAFKCLFASRHVSKQNWKKLLLSDGIYGSRKNRVFPSTKTRLNREINFFYAGINGYRTNYFERNRLGNFILAGVYLAWFNLLDYEQIDFIRNYEFYPVCTLN